MEVDPRADAVEAALDIKMKNWPPKKDGVWSGQFSLSADENGNGQWRVSSDFLLVNVLELPKQRQSNNHTARPRSWYPSPDTPLRLGPTLSNVHYGRWWAQIGFAIKNSNKAECSKLTITS
jgi:hypothetical protein